MKHIQHRVAAANWMAGSSLFVILLTIVIMLLIPNVGAPPIYYLLLFLIPVLVVAWLLGFFILYLIFTLDSSEPRYFYSAGIGFLSTVLLVMFVGLLLGLILMFMPNCGNLSHQTCYGTASFQASFLLYAVLMAGVVGCLSYGFIGALLAIWLRKRFIR